MKIRNRIIKITAAIVALAAVSVACSYVIDSLQIVGSPVANSTLDFKVHSTMKTNKAQTTRFVFGILVPKSWDISTAQVTFSTQDREAQGGPDLTNETMHPMDPTAIEPVSGLDWSAAFMAKYGTMGNTGLVQWAVFESDSEIELIDNDSVEYQMNLDASIPTGPGNIKFFLACAYTGSTSGFVIDTDWGNYYSEAVSTVAEVTGGTGNDDFTVFHLVSTYPQAFRYGDIFCVNFSSSVEGTTTEVDGCEHVYLCGTATLSDGTVVTVDECSERNLMKKKSESLYSKYIHPVDFFGLKKGAKIKEMGVYFKGGNGKTVMDPSTEEPFALVQADK